METLVAMAVMVMCLPVVYGAGCFLAKCGVKVEVK